MAKIHFSLKRKLKTISQCVSRQQRVLPAVHCHHLYLASRANTNPGSAKPISRLIKWTQKIGSKAKAICYGSSGHEYVKMGEDEPPVKLPNGYMGMYVGTVDEGEFQRVLIPVDYINHPLFEPLLKKYEEVFGIDYQGPITIPCPMSEFEHVRNLIKKDTKFLTRNRSVRTRIFK